MWPHFSIFAQFFTARLILLRILGILSTELDLRICNRESMHLMSRLRFFYLVFLVGRHIFKNQLSGSGILKVFVFLSMVEFTF